jgi:ribosomal protein L28
MSRTCDLCLKSSQKSATRSHSNIKSLRRQKINLQKVNGIMLCTRCIKTISREPRTAKDKRGARVRAKQAA